MSMRNHHLENWISKIKVMGLALMVFAFASLGVSAQGKNCILSDVSYFGNTGEFTVTIEPTRITITPVANPPGTPSAPIWGSGGVGRVDSNSNVEITVTPENPTGSEPVVVTAVRLDPTLSGNFVIVAQTSDPERSIKLSATVTCTPTSTCTRTQGYWKNHPEAWPVSTLQLGTVTYTKAQLLSILGTPTAKNGLMNVARQLIAAKLNVAAGTGAPASITAAISQADTLIGNLVVPPIGNGYIAPKDASSLTTTLDNFNNGLAPGGPRHCG